MNGIQEELKKAFEMLNLIFVNGDGVDILASAKLHIKKAFDLASNEGEETSDG